MARAILRNLDSLIAARDSYARINVPVTLVYGDHDWSRPSDRQASIESVPGADHIVLRDLVTSPHWRHPTKSRGSFSKPLRRKHRHEHAPDRVAASGSPRARSCS